MAQFKAGDVVVLKSGSPDMTVIATYEASDPWISAVWSFSNEIHRNDFPAVALRLVDTQQEIRQGIVNRHIDARNLGAVHSTATASLHDLAKAVEPYIESTSHKVDWNELHRAEKTLNDLSSSLECGITTEELAAQNRAFQDELSYRGQTIDEQAEIIKQLTSGRTPGEPVYIHPLDLAEIMTTVDFIEFGFRTAKPKHQDNFHGDIEIGDITYRQSVHAPRRGSIFH